MTGVSIIQFAETSSTITLTENRATILQGVENVGPPGGPGGGGGAPTDASYVTLGTNGTLTDERVLTAGTGITITDAGAGSTVTVGVTANTYQPLDSDLTAIAALSTTAYGRALLALADAAALRTAAAVGTVSTLASDTDGTLAANSDSNVATQKATKTYADLKLAKASNLSDLANAATARTNLGLGSAATQASSAFDAAGAAAAAQAYAIARANHTGTQTASTISDFDTQVATTAILKSLIDAKGDVLAGTADNTIARVAVGLNGKALKADSTATPGVAWDYAVPPHGSTKNGSTTYYSTPGFWTTSATTSALVANYCFYFPIYAATPVTADQLAIEQTGAAAAGKLMRFGLIAADKWWQPTGSALADSGNIAADGANGVKTYTPGSALSLSAGRYLGVIHSDGAPTLRAWAGVGLGDSHPTTLGANVNCFWRVSKALGAIDATAWDTVSTVTAMYTQIVLRVSEPAA